MIRDVGAAGSNPVIPTSRSKGKPCSVFLCQEKQTPAFLLLLFRKKSRSVRLLSCKRLRGGSLSLSTFHDFALRCCQALILLYFYESPIKILTTNVNGNFDKKLSFFLFAHAEQTKRVTFFLGYS